MLFNDKSIRFLSELTTRIIREASIEPGAKLGEHVSELKGTILEPSATGGYAAFWVRDPVMSAVCGLIPAEVQRDMFRIIAEAQADREFRTDNGLGFVPSGSIADHVLMDGRAVFYPGTYNPADQGGEPWGILPPFDDPFYFILLGSLIFEREGPAFLSGNFRGKTAAERMLKAFDSVPADPETQLVCCQEVDRGVSFGFFDSIPFTGSLLFASLLRRCAAMALQKMGLLQDSFPVSKITCGIERVFSGKTALLMTSTGKNAKPDIWGTLYAIYTGALTGGAALKAADLLRSEWHNGSLCRKYAVTQIFEEDYFESPCCKPETYQNGAFWYTASGWMIYALSLVNPRDADEFFEGLCDAYQSGLQDGKPVPYECFNPDNGCTTANTRYMTSAALPLAAVLRLSGKNAVPAW